MRESIHLWECVCVCEIKSIVSEQGGSDLSQLKPSTLSLHWHWPVWTSHSWVLPEGLQEQGLGEVREREA